MGESRSVTEVNRHFADYINRVVYRGERFTLVRGNKPVAELIPSLSGKRLSELPHLLNSLPGLSEKEAKEFGEDLVTGRSGLSATEVRDPWGS
jgi:prevent-host-death family protein